MLKVVLIVAVDFEMLVISCGKRSTHGQPNMDSGVQFTSDILCYRLLKMTQTPKCHELETAPIRGQRRDDLMENLRITPIDKNAILLFLESLVKMIQDFITKFKKG